MTYSSDRTRATKPTRTVPRIQMIVLLLFCLIQGVINQNITDESKICNRRAFARYSERAYKLSSTIFNAIY